MLYRLVSASQEEVVHVVISLQDDGHFGAKLRHLDIPVHSLKMSPGKVSIRVLASLRRLIIDERPDVVQTWMHHADLMGGLVARLSGIRNVSWGLRCSNLGPTVISRSARLCAWICARFSYMIPSVIVANSHQAAQVHQALGYRPDIFRIVPNGVDLAQFCFQPGARSRVRTMWGVDDDEYLIGMVARWDPQKDHANLLSALALLAERDISFRCALVGSGMSSDNHELMQLIRDCDVNDCVILAGPIDNVPEVMNAIDLHVLSSIGESFPNVVVEAMACGTPCVVTNVGDSALIVGDAGWVVPPSNSRTFAEGVELALKELTTTDRRVLGQAARNRIKNYSIERMAGSYVEIWSDLVHRGNNGKY